ncbi:hypothetical protein [Haloprofundus halobius]|uniref:hypothetical protein n=1 Tax=Haloprofundus halobius TaxID=2876194 RepID=UPI001CCF4E0B|nr:hypothetical protein [Haloprofundus halobius]
MATQEIDNHTVSFTPHSLSAVGYVKSWSTVLASYDELNTEAALAITTFTVDLYWTVLHQGDSDSSLKAAFGLLGTEPVEVEFPVVVLEDYLKALQQFEEILPDHMTIAGPIRFLQLEIEKSLNNP